MVVVEQQGQRQVHSAGQAREVSRGGASTAVMEATESLVAATFCILDDTKFSAKGRSASLCSRHVGRMNECGGSRHCLHIVAAQGSSTGREGAVKTEENHSCPLVGGQAARPVDWWGDRQAGTSNTVIMCLEKNKCRQRRSWGKGCFKVMAAKMRKRKWV